MTHSSTLWHISWRAVESLGCFPIPVGEKKREFDNWLTVSTPTNTQCYDYTGAWAGVASCRIEDQQINWKSLSIELCETNELTITTRNQNSICVPVCMCVCVCVCVFFPYMSAAFSLNALAKGLFDILSCVTWTCIGGRSNKWNRSYNGWYQTDFANQDISFTLFLSNFNIPPRFGMLSQQWK